MIGAAIAGVGSVVNAVSGVVDMIAGNKKRKEAQSFFNANKYDIPESAQSALDIAQRQASTHGLAGQDAMEAKIQASTAQGVGMAKEVGQSSSDVLAMLAGLYGNEQNKMQDIGIAGAQDYETKQRQLQQALGTMAGYENEKWVNNVQMPYQQMLGTAEALSTRGRQGLQSGVQGLASVGMGLEQMSNAQNQYDSWFNNLFGGGNTQNSQANANAYVANARSNMNLGTGTTSSDRQPLGYTPPTAKVAPPNPLNFFYNSNGYQSRQGNY